MPFLITLEGFHIPSVKKALGRKFHFFLRSLHPCPWLFCLAVPYTYSPQVTPHLGCLQPLEFPVFGSYFYLTCSIMTFFLHLCLSLWAPSGQGGCNSSLHSQRTMQGWWCWQWVERKWLLKPEEQVAWITHCALKGFWCKALKIKSRWTQILLYREQNE